MKTAREKTFVSPGQRNEVSGLSELRKNYPAVFQWFDEYLTNPYLSGVGEANCARRFKLPLETFQTLLKAYRGEGDTR